MLLAALVALILLLALVGESAGLEMTALVLATGLLVGKWIQSRWYFPGVLRQAEVLWDEGAAPSAVAARLAGARQAHGELGYRVHLLLARAHLAQGFRNQAWADLLNAQLARLPVVKRGLVVPCFRALPESPGPWRIRYAEWMVGFAPRLPHLRHRLGILYMKRNGEGDGGRAWEQFKRAVPLAAEDPLILEDLMLAALSRGELPIAEQALALLMSHHNDPRLPWDRSAPSAHLLQQGRSADALALFRSLPTAFRSEPWHWAGEARALRRLGDGDGAWTALEDGLTQFPESFRLWLERYQMAMDRLVYAEARHCIEKAEAVLPLQESPELRWEWQVRRAEFAYWIDDDPRGAWNLLRTVPVERRGQLHPPLDLELQVALGDFENALARCKDLLGEHPGDPTLLLMQGDCLAGLEAWEALLPFLDGLSEEPRQRAEFWHLHGLALARAGDALGSRMDLERAALMGPNDLRMVLDAGHACADLSEWERSENHWRQALHLDESCEEALVQLSESRTALHDPEGARRFLRECLVHHPESQEAQERLSELESN